MADITDINQYKKGVDMGKRLESDMNFDSTSLFKSILIDNYYPNSFHDVMKYIFKSRHLLTLYDVGLFLMVLLKMTKSPVKHSILHMKYARNLMCFLC